MFFVYILKSKADNKLYYGYTKDLRKRLQEHNLGLVPATKARRPLYCVYYEAYAKQSDATKREHNLKLRAKALLQLTKRIRASLES